MLRRQCSLSSAGLFLVGFALLGSAACSVESAERSDRGRGAPEQQGPVVLSDADIAAVVSAMNTGEIQQAHIALRSARLPAVIDFARHMDLMHGEAERRQSTLFARLGIVPRPNAVSESLVAEAASFTTSLRDEPAGAFDRTYILAQVAMHQRGLSLLDAQLLPRAQSPEVRAELEQARAEVAAHLASAEQILSSMGG
ncbi:DUF4142 domain-containing protein [Sorangium sp. So ce1099]|uniref:DUF4142 domain-containing protein n=1 Tax=Sorangium sp. So ce1099 TaxID=3133331 RepID=UPI003F63CA23